MVISRNTDAEGPRGVEMRTARVAGASALTTLIAVTLQLVAVPVCLSNWGQEIYGLWLAIFATFMLLRTTDSGLINYTGNQLNILYYQDQETLRRTLASAIWGASIVGAIQLLLCAAILFSGSLAEVLSLPGDTISEHRAGLALLVLVVGWALTGPYLSIVHRLLVPAGMLYQSTWWAMGYQISHFVTLVTAALLHATVFQASLAAASVQAALYVVSAIYVKQKLPHFFPWWERPRWRTALRDLYRSMVLFGAGALQQASANGLVVLLSSFMGAVMAPAFTTVRTVANLWTMVANVLVGPLLPEIVRYHASREWRKIIAAQHAYWVFAGLTINLSVLVCFPFLEQVFQYWTRGKITLDRPLLYFLLATVVLATQGALMNSYLHGINNLRAVMLLSIMRGLVPVILSLILIPAAGLAGLGFALLVGEALALFLGYTLLIKELRRFKGVSNIGNMFFDALGSLFVLAFLFSKTANTDYSSMLYAMALIGVTGSAYRGWLQLDADVRLRAGRLLAHVIKRRGTI